MTSKKVFTTDILLSILLIAITLFYAFRYVNFSIPPFEDAAMLMRYAQHLAQGYGIVWNIGEHPVDGATDFLFMVVSAFFIKLGLSVGQSIRGVGFSSHILTVLIVYWGNRRVNGSSMLFSFLSGLYLAFGTGLAYVAAYFGTPFFALAAASTWTLGLLLIKKQNPPFWLSLTFALSGLVTGLIRPEGVILAVLMLLSVVILRGFKNSISIMAIFGVVLLVLGGGYFLWRWNYFGYPLPNPFYKKGAGVLHWDSLAHSLSNTLRLCLPFALLGLLGFRSSETTKQTLAFLIPILGFASAFVMISDEMNYGARFQYVLVPIALLSWPAFIRGLNLPWPNQITDRERRVYFTVLIALSAAIVYYSWYQNCYLTYYQRSCIIAFERDGRYNMGALLAQYRDKGYVIATTEAGLIPYYSGWMAIDTWGLNDSFIAHNGGLTAAYLDQYKPNIIMFHDYYSPLVPPKLTDANLAQKWFSMTILMKDYAESHGYVLAAIFGDSPYDTHYYYVRPDFADSARIIEQISKMKNYYYPTTGKKAINYENYAEP